MVVTRRTRSADNSLARSDDDNASLASARGSSRAGSGTAARPPPPPPPPVPPPPGGPPQLGGAPTDNRAEDERRPLLPPPAADDAARNAGWMAAIPEEVAVNDINNDDEGGRRMIRGGILEGTNDNAVLRPNNRNNDNNNDAMAAAAPGQPPPNQYLRLRVPPPSQSALRPSRIHRRHHPRQPLPPNAPHDHNLRSRFRRKKPPSPPDRGEIVRVLIPRNGFASERQLAECLSQAGAVDAGLRDRPGDVWGDEFDDEYSMDAYFDDRKETTVAGMFCESDRVFVPLSVIYSNPHAFAGEVLCLKRPPPPPKQRRVLPSPGPSKRRSIFITFLELMGIGIVAVASWRMYGAAQHVDWEYVLEEALFKAERAFFSVMNFPFWLFDTLIEFPLRELYRHGPSVIGWEGEPLELICSRITYHGDEAFWYRNMDECERLYRAKELAAMQIWKPVLIGFIVLALFFMIKSIVQARAMQRRERIDPNMVETYRAIHMLMRQLRRAANAR